MVDSTVDHVNGKDLVAEHDALFPELNVGSEYDVRRSQHTGTARNSSLALSTSVARRRQRMGIRRYLDASLLKEKPYQRPANSAQKY